jgi:glycerophosphoryl diester phosphodiesterase
MIIISHRGYWKALKEKNTELAFRRSFELGYGTETDVRDVLGTLVISHDMPSGGEMTIDDYFSLPGAAELPLAMNIKSDGLADAIDVAARKCGVKRWFAFDMAVPDMRAYLRSGYPVYCRMSEVERTPAWMSECAGIWLDSFEDEWYGPTDIEALLKTEKHICVVSSELHGRKQDRLWQMLKPFSGAPKLMLCTDVPEVATSFFSSIAKRHRHD